jgi:hypothetical protein
VVVLPVRADDAVFITMRIQAAQGAFPPKRFSVGNFEKARFSTSLRYGPSGMLQFNATQHQ